MENKTMLIDDYEMLKKVSLCLILFSVIIIVLAIVFMHTMPGKIAHSKNHPQAEAIEIMSLLGLLVFPLWMVALIWAYYEQPPSASSTTYPGMTEEEFALLVERVAEAHFVEQHVEQQSSLAGITVASTDSNSTEALGSAEEIDGSGENTLNSNG